MGLHHYFGHEDLLRCRFALSPAWETMEAVRTLKLTERQGYHLPWLRGSAPRPTGWTCGRCGC